jgi:hypothetical protein
VKLLVGNCLNMASNFKRSLVIILHGMQMVQDCRTPQFQKKRPFHKGPDHSTRRKQESATYRCLSAPSLLVSLASLICYPSSPMKPGQSSSVDHGCCHTFPISNSHGHNVVITILTSLPASLNPVFHDFAI